MYLLYQQHNLLPLTRDEPSRSAVIHPRRSTKTIINNI